MKIKKFLLVALIACIILGLIYLFSPHNMAQTLRLNDNVDYCDITINSIIKKERLVLTEADVSEFYNIMVNAKVRFLGVYNKTIYRSGNYLFHVYFYSETDDYDAFIIDEDANIFVRGLRYQVLGNEKEMFLSFFMKTFPSYYTLHPELR